MSHRSGQRRPTRYPPSQVGVPNRHAFTSPRPIHYRHDRCVTVREMARLHGFPDWFRFHVTKWHGARQIGNAVPPPLARAVAETVREALAFEPTCPPGSISLGSLDLLRFGMTGAAAHWGVDVPIGKRDRKSGARKRKQRDIERELAQGQRMSYNAIIERVFLGRYRSGDVEVAFVREDLIDAGSELGVAVLRNLGDVLYTFRYRRPLPKAVLETAPADKEWTIRGAGQAAYPFRLVTVDHVVPNPSLMTIKIPDATPEIVSARAMSDEQAPLAKIRYNRFRITCAPPSSASSRSRWTRSTSPWTVPVGSSCCPSRLRAAATSFPSSSPSRTSSGAANGSRT